jgi:hypothetical protein
MSTEQFKCFKCGSGYQSTSTLNRHVKKCVGSQPVQSVQPSNTEMLIQLIRQNEELANELSRLKTELAKRDEEANEIKPITTELPYDNDQLTKIIYKYNPYNTQYSIRRNGFSPKDFKSWYTLKYFNFLDYPSTNVQFYKKCLEEILKNIPNEKLPYRIRDVNRYIYDIYDYDNKQWIKGKTEDLIQIIIKKFMLLIQNSLYGAINVLNELNTSDFHALENRKIDPTSFNRLRMELQRDLTHKFSLPDYDNDMSEEDKYNFYKKNFVKVMNERLSGEIQVEINENEFKEFEVPLLRKVEQKCILETKQEIKNKKPKARPVLKKITLNFDNDDEQELDFGDCEIIKNDDDDEGYETDTKENPYFNINYNSS